MQRLLSRRRFRSLAVSLLSVPSLAGRSGHVEPDAGLLAGLEEPDMLADEVVLLVLDFSCPDLDELPPELEGLGDEVDWDLEERVSLSLRSQ